MGFFLCFSLLWVFFVCVFGFRDFLVVCFDLIFLWVVVGLVFTLFLRFKKLKHQYSGTYREDFTDSTKLIYCAMQF